MEVRLVENHHDEYIRKAMESMVRQKEDSIKLVLDECMPRGYLLSDVARRCTFVRVAGDPNEYLYLDGKAIMEFSPLEHELTKEDDKYVMRVTQKLRRLGVQVGESR